MTMLFLNLQVTRSDIRPHKKLAVSLVIDMVTLIFLGALCVYVWVNILTLSPPRGKGEGLSLVLPHSHGVSHLDSGVKMPNV